MSTITITIDGKQIRGEQGETILQIARKNGIEIPTLCFDERVKIYGACGVCTVMLDDKPIVSCEYLAVRANGKTVLTAEGLGEEGDKIVDALVIRGGEGCGYCAPGYTVLAYAAKKELPKDATYDQVKAYLDGNLCRCTGYVVRVEALMAYLQMD